MKLVSLIKFILLLSFTACILKLNNNNSATHALSSSKLVAAKNKLWKNGIKLNVVFLNGSEQYRSEVMTFAPMWTKYANVSFSFFKHKSEVPKNEITHVLISFGSKGNNSKVGTDSLLYSFFGQVTLNFSFELEEDLHRRRRIILHEFGHILGLHHEHQNVLRNFSYNEEKLLKYCHIINGWDEDYCRESFMKIYEGKDIYFSNYDPHSIMHYLIHPSLTKEKLTFRDNRSLSLADKLEISSLYPGKMTKEEILIEHSMLKKAIEKFNKYGNCEIKEKVERVARMNKYDQLVFVPIKKYYITSIIPGHFKIDETWEDKEGVVVFLMNLKYCQFSSENVLEFNHSL